MCVNWTLNSQIYTKVLQIIIQFMSYMTELTPGNNLKKKRDLLHSYILISTVPFFFKLFFYKIENYVLVSKFLKWMLPFVFNSSLLLIYDISITLPNTHKTLLKFLQTCLRCLFMGQRTIFWETFIKQEFGNG